jgi:hypothetical protein
MEIKPNKRKYSLKNLNEKKLNDILNDIKNGSPYKIAAEANGVSDRHFYDMLLQGICDLEHDQNETLYARLAQGLRKIEREEINYCRKAILKQKKGHKGAEWTLEKVYWKYYGVNAAAIEFEERLKKLEHDNKDDNNNESV